MGVQIGRCSYVFVIWMYSEELVIFELNYGKVISKIFCEISFGWFACFKRVKIVLEITSPEF